MYGTGLITLRQAEEIARQEGPRGLKGLEVDAQTANNE